MLGISLLPGGNDGINIKKCLDLSCYVKVKLRERFYQMFIMKKSHIIGIVMIATAIGLLLSLSGEVSTYATFQEAKQSGLLVKIAGQLSKDKEMLYDPE